MSIKIDEIMLGISSICISLDIVCPRSALGPPSNHPSHLCALMCSVHDTPRARGDDDAAEETAVEDVTTSHESYMPN